MYSVVLMVAATSGGDMASFGGKDKAGCHGTVATAPAGCTGSTSCHGGGFLGLRDGDGLLKHKAKAGCHGTAPAGCTGTVAPAPVVVAPPAGCTGCHGGGFLGLRDGDGLFKKKGGCHGK